MRITLANLRRLIAESDNIDFDRYFVEDIMPMLKKSGMLPAGVGRMIGNGFEAIVFEFGSDRVIRFHPTYEYFEPQVEEVYGRMKNAPSGGLFVTIYDVGKVEGYDKERAEDVTYAVYAVMERLQPITSQEAEDIDAVVTKKASLDQLDVDPKLASFLTKYMTMPIDQDSRNVMKRGSEYVIIDPE